MNKLQLIKEQLVQRFEQSLGLLLSDIQPYLWPSNSRKSDSSRRIDVSDITAEAQRIRLLEALAIAPVNTYQAREEMNIMQPAARIKELRERGHNIATIFKNLPDSCGRLHPRTAEYVLLNLKREASNDD